MTEATGEVAQAGHVFISYVREDAEHVDALAKHLSAAGIAVWRDTDALWPGQDWRAEIRRSIQSGTFAFLACFSDASQARDTSYQNEELLLAVDQQRLRPVGRPWLIPVRFGECAIPDHDLGAGRTLSSINRIDLFGDDYDVNMTRLVSGVLRIVGETSARRTPPAAAVVEPLARRVKNLLRGSDDIELEDLALEHAAALRESLGDRDRFPMQLGESDLREVIDRSDAYFDLMVPLCEVLAVGCGWGRSEEQGAIWTRAVEAVVNAPIVQTGSTRLIELQYLPEVVLEYAGAIAAVYRSNWAMFRAVTLDVRVRRPEGRAPLAGVARPWRPFANAEPAANVLALRAGGAVIDDVDQALADFSSGRKGKRYTPCSDMLHDRLRPLLTPVILDDQDFTDSFDVAETMLAALAIDLDRQWQDSKQGVYIGNPALGSTTWRHRHGTDAPELRLIADLDRHGDAWPPLRAGLFDGDRERASESLSQVGQIYTDVRRQRF